MDKTRNQNYEQNQREKGLFPYKRWIPKSWFKLLDKKIEELEKER